MRVCGNGYKSIVLVVSRLYFLTVLARGQNPLLSDNIEINPIQPRSSTSVPPDGCTAAMSILAAGIIRLGELGLGLRP